MDLYSILNISKDASPSDIKKAYYKLAKDYHPDKNSAADAPEKFKKISEAYEILSNNEKKERYDKYGIMNDDGGINPDDIFNQFANMGFGGMEFGPFAGFSRFPGFGGMNFAQNFIKLDCVCAINIKLNHLYTGYKERISYDRIIYNGKTKQSEKVSYDINLNPGFDPRDKIVIKNHGHKMNSENGTKTGNLIMEIRIEKSEIFKIDSHTLNLYTTQKITLVQSLCGISMSIKMPDNTILKYCYDNIIEPKKLYEIKDVGLPYIKNGSLSRHSLFIEFEVIYNSYNKETLDGLRKAFKFDVPIKTSDIKEIKPYETDTEEYDNINDNYEQTNQNIECKQQ